MSPLIQSIPYRCPECHVTAIVPTDLARMSAELAKRFIDDPKLAIETECVECIAKVTAKLIDIGELRPGDEKVMHMICGTLHGPEQKCPLLGSMN
jgi:hypothetical protein